MQSLTRLKELGIHAGVWASFIVYEISMTWAVNALMPLYQYACFYLINIGLFYFNAHIGWPFTMRYNKRGLILILIIVVELCIYDLISISIDIVIDTIKKGHFYVDIISQDWVRSTWRGIYFLGLSTGYYFALRSISNAQKSNFILQQKLVSERREAVLENAYIRAQINPHLFFNTLNFILSSVEGDAAESIFLLAESMRYAMMPAQQDGKIELYKEIEQIERYIQLHQIPSKGKLKIHLLVAPDCYAENLRIPPLLLLTFVENIFKHGNLNDHSAKISMRLADGELYFHTENLKTNSRGAITENIGLTNSRLRLQKYYQGEFQLTIDTPGSVYITNLNLKL